MTLNWHRILLAVAVIVGAATGPSAANSVAAQPPMAWFELALIAAGPLIGMPFAVGIQVASGRFRGHSWGWRFFLYVGVYFTILGLVALGILVRHAGWVPNAFQFLVVGVALLSGFGLVRVIFKHKFNVQS